MRYHVARTCRANMPLGNYHFGEDFFPHIFAMVFNKNFPPPVRTAINER